MSAVWESTSDQLRTVWEREKGRRSAAEEPGSPRVTGWRGVVRDVVHDVGDATATPRGAGPWRHVR